MKLKTNFAASTLMVTPAVGTTILSITLLTIIMSLILVVDRYQMKTDLISLTDENKKLSLQSEKLLKKRKKELPSLSELQEMAKKVSVLNEVSGVIGEPISIVLNRLEQALPKGTFLKSLEHYPKKGEVLLTAVSSKPDLLTHFLHQLEKDNHFKRVMLVHQSKNENKKNEVQFDLRLLVSK